MHCTLLGRVGPQIQRIAHAYSVALLYPAVCNPMDCSSPGSAVHGVFPARILEWVAISYSRGSSQPRDQTHVSCISCISRQILNHCTSQEAPFRDCAVYWYVYYNFLMVKHLTLTKSVYLFISVFKIYFLIPTKAMYRFMVVLKTDF